MKYRIGNTFVRRTDDGVKTEFFDGSVLVAATTEANRESQMETAWELGYETPEAMNRDHDVLHVLLAEARGQSRSPTLYGVAIEKPAPSWQAAEEEAIVLLMAKLMNLGLDAVLEEYRE